MSPRPYRLGQREAAALETRRRILTACEELLALRGPAGVSMDAVAERADVARATVYHQFGGKPGLLEAVVVEVQRRAGLDGLGAYLALDHPAREILGRAIPAHCRYYEAEADLFRLFVGLARADADLASVMERQAGRWRGGIAAFVQQLADEGALLADQATATAVIDLLLSFETFDRLRAGLGLDEVAEAIRSLAATVVAL